MQKVRVYWNLHKKVWSVQDGKSGLVIDHRQHLTLERARFVVRKGGQKRVREEGRKNVHAFAYGWLRSKWDKGGIYGAHLGNHWRRVTYNPYKHDYFKVQKFSDVYEYKDVDKSMEYAVFFETLATELGDVHPRTYI